MILLFLLFLGLTAASSPEAPFPAGTHLRLKLHRWADPSPGSSRSEALRSMAESDRLRQRMIASKIERKGMAPGSPAAAAADLGMEMPVWSGSYTGTGQYFVRVRMGTPAQPFLLVPDTGSDLTWVTCRYRARTLGFAVNAGKGKNRVGMGRRRRSRRVFEADLSKSFRPIACSSDLCRTQLPFSLTACPTPASPCEYDYEYAGGASAQGFFANESATVDLVASPHRRMKLKGLTIGCTSSAVGTSFVSSDGVLALGYGPATFVSRATARFGPRFSYCLVDHLSPRNATGYLAFGPNPDLSHQPAAVAAGIPLILNSRLAPFYYLAVEGISVAGELLQIPSAVWNASAGGGAIIDSGTTLTILVEPAYSAAVAALSHRLSAIPRIRMDPFEFCYNWTAADSAAVPEFAVAFTGGVQYSPPSKSYLIDVADSVKCVGLISTPWPGVSTIGNILQQDHLWEFDLQNQRLRFHPSNCRQGL